MVIIITILLSLSKIFFCIQMKQSFKNTQEDDLLSLNW